MRVVVNLLKSLLIIFLLLLLLGSGACVFVDISFLLQGFSGNGLSGQLGILLMTAIAAALAYGAGYGIYALIRTFNSNNEREQ